MEITLIGFHYKPLGSKEKRTTLADGPPTLSCRGFIRTLSLLRLPAAPWWACPPRPVRPLLLA